MGDKSPKSAAKNNKQKATQKASKQVGRTAPATTSTTIIPPGKRG